MGFHHVGQAGLKLLTSGDPLTSPSQIAGIAGMSHHDRLRVGAFLYQGLTLSPRLEYVVQSDLLQPQLTEIRSSFHLHLP
ncbi:hypothetical protein AAY473_002315, partial [Plecturocebus cupreus]